MEIQGFYDATHIARRLGVEREDVMKWANRPTANFPIPVAVLRMDSSKDRPLWSERQVPALRAWLAARLNLSNPTAHWELVDRGGEQPGGHQDQVAMFCIEQPEKEKESEPGLFSVL
ncbi:hypothetical protein ACFW2V_12565 [Streptomyces sp. NPDC058947]|uniref:hypothetical protein n=1 Tax=Streptomyces sp. NPDC058947 TaxID=3346675 RepID=UPI0036B639E5